MKYLALVLSLVCFTSCASSLLVPPQEQAAARSFTPPPGKGLLYVYKRGGITAGYVDRPVFINGKYVGQNEKGTFMAFPLNPGHYQIQAAAGAILKDGSEKKYYPEIALTVQAGKCYFIRQAMEGLTGGGGAPILIQTGGIPIPIGGGGDRLPLSATLMDPATGRAHCLQLEQIVAEP